MKYQVANAQDIGGREEQQDAFGFSYPQERERLAHAGVLGVLADGMGGLQHGAEVAQTGVRAFIAAYARKDAHETITQALERSLAESNAAVLGFVRSLNAEGAAASTLVAAVVLGRDLYWISAGDSRAYLVRQGRVFQLTVDHTHQEDSLLTPATDAGRIDPQAVTSYLGMSAGPRADRNVSPYTLQNGDWVLLASDGLFGVLSDREIGALCGADLRASCQAMLQAVLARRVVEQDNITIMAVSGASQ
ncbi:MAG: protein phosphatase 2C domain-containing protein [Vicinamibacterales bacterium]